MAKKCGAVRIEAEDIAKLQAEIEAARVKMNAELRLAMDKAVEHIRRKMAADFQRNVIAYYATEYLIH